MTALTLNEAVTNLETRGVPVDSPIRAAQHVSQALPSASQAATLIQELTGEKIGEFDHVMQAGLTYGYLVQNVTRAHIAQQPADLIELLAQAKEQAEELIDKQAWMFIADEDALAEVENADPEVVKAGKAKKGARKVLGLKVYAAEIEGKDLTRKEAIAILVEQVGLSAAGASTYYANFKSGKWA